MPQPRRRPKQPRTPEQIKAARHSKPEDLLAWGLHLHLRGESAAEIWPRYFDPQSGAFKAMAVSANHKAMAATLALREKKSVAARDYWIQRFLKELAEEMGLRETRSNKYQPWSLAAVALVWEWANDHGDRELMDLAGSVYAGTLASWSLGSTARPSQLTGDRWGGCYVSGPGIRSDPGHLEGDARAWILETELAPDYSGADTYRANASKRSARFKGLVEPSPEERKILSELWWRDAIARARKAGLAIPEELAAACREAMAPAFDADRFVPVLAEAAGRTPYAFHFQTYADGTRLNWLEDTLGERCILGERIATDGAVDVLFPYPEFARLARGGTCGIEGDLLVARSQYGEASIALPAGEPSLHLRWGPEGLVVVE